MSIGYSISQEDFISKASSLYPDLDFSNSVFLGTKKTVGILCPMHGDFNVYAGNLLYKDKDKIPCPICRELKEKEVRRANFISKAKVKHGDIYDYSDFEYKTIETASYILCKRHNGKFRQSAKIHLASNEPCPICRKNDLFEQNKENFFSRCREIHGDRYDYTTTIYKSSREPIDIRCKEHGIFTQVANEHVSKGTNCPKCAEYNRGIRYINTPTMFYCFKYKDYYKIGITTKTIEKRYREEYINIGDIDIIYTKFYEGWNQAFRYEEYLKGKYCRYLYNGEYLFAKTKNTEVFTIDIISKELDKEIKGKQKMTKRTLKDLTDAELEILREYQELFELTEEEALITALSENAIASSGSNFVYAPEGFAELKYYVVNPKSTLYKLNKALKKDKQDELFEEDTFYYDIQVKKTEDKKDFDLANCKATKVGEVPKVIITKVTYKGSRNTFDKQGNAETTNFETTLADSIYTEAQKQMLAYGGAEGNVYDITQALKKEYPDGKQGKTQENVPDKLKVKFRVVVWGLVEIDGEWKKFWMDLSNRYSEEESLVSVWNKDATGVKTMWLSELQITGSDNFDNPIIQIIPTEKMEKDTFKGISKEINQTTRDVLNFIEAQKSTVGGTKSADKPKETDDIEDSDSEDPFGE